MLLGGLPAPWSVTHTLPSLSTPMPCGKLKSPTPNCPSNFPLASKCRMGFTFDPTQVLAPHRSYAQIVPSGATSTPAVDPHLRTSGSWPKLTPGLYGFCSSFFG